MKIPFIYFVCFFQMLLRYAVLFFYRRAVKTKTYGEMDTPLRVITQWLPPFLLWGDYERKEFAPNRSDSKFLNPCHAE